MASEVPRPGSRQAEGCGSPSGSSSCAPAATARGFARSASTSAATAPGRSSVSSLSSRQSSPRASRSSRESFSALPRAPLERDQPQPLAEPVRARVPALDLLGRAVVGGVVEHQHLVVEALGCGVADRVEAGGQVLPPVGVDDAVGQLHRRESSRMRVQVVDPPAYTPPYDRALCAALARAGAEVELVTTRFPYGPVPEPEGYRVSELFYPRAARLGPEAAWPAGVAARRAPARDAAPALARRERADVVHLQWLALPALDRLLLPPRPRVLTVHDPPPAAGRALAAQRRLFDRMDALVAHSEAGAARLRELGADPSRVHRIPHGVFDHLTRQPDERPLPPELAAVEGPVVLCFGLIRPYKGIDVLLEAFRELEGAELWIVGMPRMPLAALERAGGALPGEGPLRRAVHHRPRDPGLLPARRPGRACPIGEIEQSGVLYTALAFERRDRRQRRRRLRRGRGRDRGPAPGPARRPAGARRRARRAARRPRRARAAGRGRRPARPPGPTRGTRIAERTLALYRGLLGG